MRISDTVFSVLRTCFANAVDFFNKAVSKRNFKDLCKFLSNRKGTKLVRELLWHEHPLVHNLTSTSYWIRNVQPRFKPTLLYHSFDLLAKINVSPKVKQHLVKMRHNIYGTNRYVNKIDPTIPDVCNFCVISKREMDKCTTGDLLTMLYSCPDVKDFYSTLLQFPPYMYVNLGLSSLQRLVYTVTGKDDENFVNIIQLLINNFLRECSFCHVLPTILGCSKSILKLITPILKSTSRKIPIEDLAAFEMQLRGQVAFNDNL